MKRTLVVTVSLVAAFALAGSSSARQSDLATTRLSPTVVVPQLPATLDPRLAQIALSVRMNGSGAALDAARAGGLLVTQGKVRVVVHVRAGHLTGARAAVRHARGDILVASVKVLEALVPPKQLQRLAASRYVARVSPVASGSNVSTTMGLRIAPSTTSVPPLGETIAGAPFDLASDASIPEHEQTIGAGTFGLVSDASIPGPPNMLVAETGDGQATISFDPPDSDGGDSIAYYTATAYPGGKSASGVGSPIVVSGLTNGVQYVFTVTATNGVGTSADSLTSNPVTPGGGSRLDPEPPAGAGRPGIPSYTAPSGPRSRPHHDTGEF